MNEKTKEELRKVSVRIDVISNILTRLQGSAFVERETNYLNQATIEKSGEVMWDWFVTYYDLCSNLLLELSETLTEQRDVIDRITDKES